MLGQEPCLAAFSLESVRRYVADLRGQTCWATHEGMPAKLRARLLSDGTVSWHVRRLGAVSIWLLNEGYTAENILARLKPPKVADCEVDILSEGEIGRIVSELNHHAENGSRD